MANPYDADVTDDAGNVRISGAITFTDPANQPGGSGTLPVAAGVSGSVGDVVGVVYSTPGVFVVGGVDKDTPLNGNGAVLTDAFAQWNGNGAGVFWSGTGTDGDQSLLVRNDAGLTTLHDADGNMSVVGSVTSDVPLGRYDSGGDEVIANNDNGALAFAYDSGDTLLDLTDTDLPTFVDAGTYGLTITVDVTVDFTAGGYGHIQVGTPDDALIVTLEHLGGVTVSGIVRVAANAALSVLVTNRDGVAARTFALTSASIVKLG